MYRAYLDIGPCLKIDYALSTEGKFQIIAFLIINGKEKRQRKNCFLFNLVLF